MSLRGVQLDRERFSCSICQDLLRDPVTIPCGHSYCMDCIKKHWDEEDHRRIHSCPQCRKSFVPRPVLVKNTMLADLVEELEATGLKDSPHHHCSAGPGDVACDFCTGRKLKATKSCLQCMASYCELHLQPHYDSLNFQKHKLVEASAKLQENICSRHNKVMEIFCRTDQQCICYLCSLDAHKGHNTVSAEAERTQRQRELGQSRQKIQQKIQDREKDVKVLQQEVEAISRSADEAMRDSETTFNQLLQLIQKRSCDVKQQIRSQQETEVSRARELQEKLEQEITELRRRDTELERLSLTEDHSQFLQSYPSLSGLCGSTDSPAIDARPLRYFEEVTAAVSELRDKLQDILNQEWTKVSQTVTEVDVLLPPAEPKTRAEFLQFSCQITLDPNTVNKWLLLSEGNRKVTRMDKKRSYPRHPDRFTDGLQVLSRQTLTGRCYWEVKWTGTVSVAVTYKSISRTGSESVFGFSDKSWALWCPSNEFRHNSIRTSLSGPRSSRVGLYLDHRAGILSFYSVSETMTLLRRVQTTFSQSLHAGLWVCSGSAELCQLQ
ncbi:tripartite motif-containing protein 16-like [Lates calcarifer]|uniref:Tripartite motif-containing protein 16-like n=1 Tax=Lates calcarifer TaxID=8187 RepID=A0A4W6E7E1_LATCA|nr:tripartite motif-containing protein 16-like [Lates calcarifer]